MRFKLFIFVAGVSFAQAASAQNQAPAGPSILDAQRGAPNPAKATPADVLTVSDATKQASPQTPPAGGTPGQMPAATNGGYAPRAGAAQTEAKPIQVLDATGMPLDTAAVRTTKTKVRQPQELELVRFSERDGRRKAVISVNGVNRLVDVGSEVLDRVVTEIRKDVVCFDSKDNKPASKSDGKSKKCSKSLKFELQREE